MGREFSTPWLQGPPMSSDHTLSLPYPSCQCPLLPLCFQSLPTIKFSNLFVLITMQNTPGCTPPCNKTLQKIGGNPRSSLRARANAALAASDAGGSHFTGTGESNRNIASKWGVVPRDVGRRSNDAKQ